MSTASDCIVEFVGGPLDGHEQFVAVAPHDLNDVVLLPVGRILALLYNRRISTATNSLALYELDSMDAARPTYQYAGSVRSG